MLPGAARAKVYDRPATLRGAIAEMLSAGAEP